MVSDITAPMKASVMATLRETEQIGLGAWNPDFEHDVELLGTERAQHVLELRLHAGEPRRHVHHDRKERDQKGGQHRGHDADAEPDDQDRHHCHLGDRVEADHHGIEAAIDRARPADDDAEHDAEGDGKGKAGERCPQRDEGVLGKRQPVLADGLKYLRRRREHEGVDLENAADELPEHEHADSEQPGRQSFQRGTHGLRTSAILARSSWTMLVKCGSKQMSRSRGRGRSTVLVMTMCPGRALMTWMLSARNAASRRSCVTRITVKPSFCHKSRSTHHNSSRVKASSAANGSSSINSAG